MRLHTNPKLFQDAVIATAQYANIPEIYIEKDYWITVALHAIFHSPIAEQAVFKGGTALSKCYKLIDRFSEDIDIMVLKKGGESDNKLKSKLKLVTDAVHKVLPEVSIEGLTRKMGQIRKTAHQYHKQSFQGSFGQVREQIVVEATSLGSAEPYTTASVYCYMVEMMLLY